MYPQYDDMSDKDLAGKLHAKFYSDMPDDEFNSRVGLKEEPKQQPKGKEEDNSNFALETVKNIPDSAKRAVKDMAQPFIHPIETAENIANLGKGVMQELGLMKGSESKKYPEAVGKFLMERYGGKDEILHTLKTDPVGMALDISTVLSGGETALARVPGAIGKVGEVAGTVGRAVDPLVGAGKAAKAAAKPAGKLAANIVGGLGTRTGPESLEIAYEAGREGGQAGKAFREHETGAVPKEEIVTDAKKAVTQLRDERGKAYREGMKDVKADTTVLSFDEIDKAVDKIDKVASFKGQNTAPATEAIRGQVKDIIDEWKQLPAKDFHTPEGLDALKQKINSVRKTIPYTAEHAQERLVADEAYHAVRQTIIKQNPAYAHVMKGYEEASDLIDEMERTLSLNKKGTIDTQLRKLQSVLRDNVNTSYGRRRELAEFLVDSGAPNLLQKIAGQTLSTLPPRGLGGLGASIEAVGALTSGNPKAALYALPILAVASPRVMGDLSYFLGTLARNGEKFPLRATAQSTFQAGRFDEMRDLLVNIVQHSL